MRYLTPILFIGFIISWSAYDPYYKIKYYEVKKQTRGGTTEIVVGTSPDTCLMDSLVMSGVRYDYRLRACNNAGKSPYSRTVSGMFWDILPDVKGRSESKSWAPDSGDLLVISYPSGPWIFSWSYRPGFERVTAKSFFDGNGDEVINLSDLSLWADRLRESLSLFSMFGAVYNGPAYFEYFWEAENFPGTEAEKWLMEKLTRQSWKSFTADP